MSCVRMAARFCMDEELASMQFRRQLHETQELSAYSYRLGMM